MARRREANIDAWLRGERSMAVESNTKWPSFEKLNPWYYADAPKTVRPMLDIIRRQSTFEEVQGGLDETNALFEARRCLRLRQLLRVRQLMACAPTTR